ncbi:hypothetical protein Bca52824_093071 [Brassica carinata]|uniref:RNase H type-1 domain-containing protein n=1 Tax=Brassica carinata TaxID=52824 RepID=A0A8X7TKD0_BRACI|nr:hypothetical protein Bca52824_093071 [Brassica carinata]
MESEAAALSESASGSWNPGGSTGYNIGIFDACSSGTKGRKTYQRRRRPGSFVRKARGKETSANAIEGGKLKEDEPAAAGKRKNTKDVETSQYSPRLTRIGINRKIPWCVMGDFNAIRHNGEKLEGPRRSEAHFQPFNDMIQAVKLFAGGEQHIGRFRFDSRFLCNPQAKEEIKKAWMSVQWTQNPSVSERIHKVRRDLKQSSSSPSSQRLAYLNRLLILAYKEEEDEEQAEVLMGILDRYGRATGQRLNMGKSAITFGKKIHEEMRAGIKRITGIEKEGGTGSYLGLPECFSGSKTEMLAYIYDRLKNRLSGYFLRLLSQGGKEVLLKAVAMAMSVYAMSCFKLTKTSCNNLTQAMAAFWWDSLEHKRKIHWLSWDKMCLSKHHGGLAFKDIQTFNQALLAKQAWRIIDQPDSLFARELLSLGLRKQIGKGNTISVSHLIDRERRTWNRAVLEELFFPDDIASILKMKPAVDDEDYWTWCHNRNGAYSVKSGYWMMNNEKHSGLIQEAAMLPSLNSLKEAVWKVKTAPKIRTFINVFGFEGRRFNALEIALKIIHEADSWFISVEMETSRVEEEKKMVQPVIIQWEPPQLSWLKCNIGVHWRKDIGLGGAAWVLRDCEGNVLMHSRRVFTGLNNLKELKLQVIMWAIESMASHKLNRVIFAFDDDMIVEAIMRPKAWPSFKAIGADIMFSLRKIEWWRLVKEAQNRNRGAFLIAISVTRNRRTQSYVAAGSSFWLQDLFDNEKRLASL